MRYTILECKEFKYTVNDGNNNGNSQQIRICIEKSLLQRPTDKCNGDHCQLSVYTTAASESQISFSKYTK